MTIIRTPSEDEATGQVAVFYADDIRDQGYVASHTKALSLNPEALLYELLVLLRGWSLSRYGLFVADLMTSALLPKSATVDTAPE